jgi:hypothetical protein
MTAKKEGPGKTIPRKKKVTEQEIRNRARDIYEERITNGIHGDAESDWLRAEKELMKRRG